MSQSYALSDSAAPNTSAGSGIAQATGPVLLAVFMATFVIPVSFDLAGLRLSPIRIFLLLSFVPLLLRLLGGRAGRLSTVDLFVGLFSVWLAISLLVMDGMARFAFVGISAVELAGGYLVGRCLIRNAADFRLLWKFHFATLLFLLPFVIIDSFTGRQIWTEILDLAGDVIYRGDSSRPRMGLHRVITGFEHPILYGLYCSLGAAVGFYVLYERRAAAVMRLALIALMTFFSLSSGALLSVMIQAQLMTWDWISRSRWKLLLALTTCMFVFLSFASNRGPILIFIETFTFSRGNAWTRVFQWRYGTAEVMLHPIFGIGLTGDWERPEWLVSSVDNFWLAMAMRHGLPGVTLLLLTIVCLVLRTVRAKDLPPIVRRCRTGYLITLVGLCFTLGTVHIWGAVSVFVMMYIGSGLWIADAARTGSDGDATPEGPERPRTGPGHPPRLRRDLSPGTGTGRDETSEVTLKRSLPGPSNDAPASGRRAPSRRPLPPNGRH